MNEEGEVIDESVLSSPVPNSAQWQNKTFSAS
jgi:type VI protein secretion system component VasF